MESDNPVNRLKHCEQAFRLAGIAHAYEMLNLPEHLAQASKPHTLAAKLHLDPAALERFLNATTFMGLTTKNQSDEFQHLHIINYSIEPTLMLIDLIEQNLPDKIYNNHNHTIEESDITNDTSHQLLEKAVENGLIDKTNSSHYRIFDELVPYLCSSGLMYIGPKLHHYKKIMLNTFAPETIINALKEGRSQWKIITGHEDTSTAFNLYASEPHLVEIFTRGIHTLNSEDNDKLCFKLKLAPHLKVLDIGGGSSAIAISLLKSTPSLQIYLYEHPDAIPLMKKILRDYADDKQLAQITYISGNFLNDLNGENLPGLSSNEKFSMICFAWILHDWTDEVCIKLLKRAKNHLTENGQLVIIEEILPDSKVSQASISDITMLLHTEGKERTFPEYKHLIIASGFKEKEIQYQPTDTRRQIIIITQDD